MSTPIDLTVDDDDVVSVKMGNPCEVQRSFVEPHYVNVKLRSLDGGLDRNILFSDKVGLYEITVGRASKNHARGMIPQKGNAWIDSPVLSRNHATIFIESGNRQTIFIKDLQSTHGTRLNGNKITPLQKVQIKSGDHLSFGSTVMAGHDTFKAKEWEVTCQWELLRPSPIVLTPSSSSGNGRRTFSVPSLSDSDEISSDEDSDKNLGPEISAVPVEEAQAPLHPMESVVPGAQDLMMPEDIAESRNAALEDGTNPETTSDNEGPESLPIIKSKPLSKADRLESAAVFRNGLNIPDDPSESSKTAHNRNCLGSSPAPMSPSYSPSSPEYVPSPSMDRDEFTKNARQMREESKIDGSMECKDQPTLAQRSTRGDNEARGCGTNHYDPEQRDWYDQDDELDAYGEMDDDTDNRYEGDYPSCDEESIDNSQSTSDENASVEEDAVSILSNDESTKDEPNEIGSSTQPVLGARTSSRLSERIPSPSDAAMAKPTSFSSTQKDKYLVSPPEMNNSLEEADHTQPIRPAPPPVSFAGTNGFDVPWEPFDLRFPTDSNLNTHFYTQGPFARPDCNYSPYRPPTYRLQQDTVEENIQQAPSLPYYGGDQLVDMEIGSFGNRHNLLPSLARPDPPRIWREPQAQLQPPQLQAIASTKPSKLTISQLVNDSGTNVIADGSLAGHVSSPRKRKVDEMSQGSEPATSVDRMVRTESAHSTRETQSPPLEASCATPEIVEAVPILEGSHQREQDGETFTDAQPRENLDLSTVSNFSVAVVQETPETDGPTPKKLKLGSESTGASITQRVQRKVGPWIRKAASHAIYGGAWAAVGATAAVAALIATVPEDVQREAFAEM